jgi:DNA-binding transcriptional MocR family regulator
VPDELERALRDGARAVIATPRAQNPTGAAMDPERGRVLREILAKHSDVLVVEDDYLAAAAGAPYVQVRSEANRWAVIRSLAKVLVPDLRVAPMAGDPLTISRVEGRQLLGPGWVSHLLQQTAALLWSGTATKRLLARAEQTYAERRRALVEALSQRGITAYGASGLGVWVPVAEEASTTELLLERGWAVGAGERYRINSPPAIRITTATLLPDEAEELAAAIAEIAGTAGAGITYLA